MSPDLKQQDTVDPTDGSTLESDSLELTTDVENIAAAPSSSTNSDELQSNGNQPPKKPKRRPGRFNVYLLLFILIIVIAGAATVVLALARNKQQQPASVTSQSLSTDTLKQLATSDATVGEPKQVLNVQSNAVFAGKVLIRDSLDVAGTIHVGGALSLPGITVSGNSEFDSVQVTKNLGVGGDTSVQGQLGVKKNLTVSGSGTFGGAVSAPQVTTSQLQLLSDLTLTSHIIAGGATPGRSVSAAVGNGGTASVSGSDTSGSININSGSSPAAGCYITVNFSKKYNNTPKVILSPTSSASANIGYYASRTTTGFSVCATSPPTANSGLSFDYIVIG